MIKKTKTALGLATATLTLAGALVAPQASAQTQAERVADAAAKKTAVLEAQVNEMATMMEAMQAELSRVKSVTADATLANTAKVQELDQWVASIQHAPVQQPRDIGMFFARGGWMRMNHSRGSTVDALGAGTGVGTDILTSEVDNDAFYYGGGFEYTVNNDLFGLWDGTSFIVEFGIEYSELGEREESGLTRAITTLDTVNGGTLSIPGVLPGNLQKSVTVNMLRVNASPKIKFMHGSKLRPWIIPMGLDFNIISPPSDAVTVLNTGMNFGAGVDYELYRGITIGVDGRYHWTPDDIDGIDTDGFQLGGMIGFKY